MITPDIVVKAIFLIGSFFVGFAVGVRSENRTSKKEQAKQRQQQPEQKSEEQQC